MPGKLYISKNDAHTLVVDGEMHRTVKQFARENMCSLAAATCLLLARGWAWSKGADPSKIQLPHDPHLGQIPPLDNA